MRDMFPNIYRNEKKAFKRRILENINMYHSLFEMAQLTPKETGLPYSVWFEEFEVHRNHPQRKPRVKIGMPNGDFIPVSIEENPKILLGSIQLAKADKEFNGEEKKKMFEFISQNRDSMLKHWNDEIDTAELFVYKLMNR